MLLYVDIIDACHLRCPTCARGSRAMPNTSRKMPLSLFEEVVAKGREEGAYRIDLFNWIEPFICRDLERYVEAVARAGLPCGVASTLSLRRIPNLAAVLAHAEILTVTLSGITQETYAINHRGGNLAYVMDHLETISALRRGGEITTYVELRFLRFDYNAHEQEAVARLAHDLGFSFQVLLASGDPCRWTQAALQAQTVEAVRSYRAGRPQEEGGKVCPLIFEHVPLDAAGEVFLCSAVGNFEILRIGSYLGLSREESLWRRYTHPRCNVCSWRRRSATPIEKTALYQSLAGHLRDPIVVRVPALSAPLPGARPTSQGFYSKDGR